MLGAYLEPHSGAQHRLHISTNNGVRIPVIIQKKNLVRKGAGQCQKIAWSQIRPPANTVKWDAKFLKRQLTRSLKDDWERLWIAECGWMEKYPVIENGLNLYRPIRNTGPRKPEKGEVIKEYYGLSIHSQDRRLERCAEHFREQSNWAFHLCMWTNAGRIQRSIRNGSNQRDRL